MEIVRGAVEALGDGDCRGIALSGDASLVGWWDAARIEQVVTNLLTNAVKYGEGKPIEIRVEGDGERVRLAVRDHGSGIYLDFDSAEKTCVRERSGIFNAYLLPGKDQALYLSISPVNTFRVIFNAVFGEPLTLAEDRSYYSTWNRPYAYTDVTNRRQECVPVEGGHPTDGVISVWAESGTDIQRTLTAAAVKFSAVEDMGGGRYVLMKDLSAPITVFAPITLPLPISARGPITAPGSMATPSSIRALASTCAPAKSPGADNEDASKA